MESANPGFVIDLEAQHGEGTIRNSGEVSDHSVPESTERRDSDKPGVSLDTSDAINKPGVIGLSAYESHDLTNITRRAYIEPLSYCQIIQQQYIENLWSELKDTADADGPYLVDRARKLHKEIMRYHKSIFQLNKVCSLDQADPKFLKEYLREAEHRLSRLPPQDRGFLNAGALEWIKPFSVDKLEGLVYQLTNHRFGRLLLRPSRWERQENGNRVYEYYGRSVIEALVWGGFIGLICAFIGIPVMLQTLKVTSAAGQAVTYLSFLLGFGVVAKALLSTFNLTLIATLAYAGILAANMRHG